MNQNSRSEKLRPLKARIHRQVSRKCSELLPQIYGCPYFIVKIELQMKMKPSEKLLFMGKWYDSESVDGTKNPLAQFLVTYIPLENRDLSACFF